MTARGPDVAEGLAVVVATSRRTPMLRRLGRPGRMVAVGVSGKVVEVVTQALLVLLVPLALGPIQYGAFVLALTVVSLGSSSLSLGGPALISRFVPAARPSERPAVARALAVRAGRWRAIELAAVAVVVAVLVGAAPHQFPPVVTLLIVAAVAFDVAATLAFQVALGLGHASVFSFRYGVQNAIVVAGALAGHAAAGVNGAIAGIVVASAVTLAWAASTVGVELARAPAGAPMPPGALRFGALQVVGNLFGLLRLRGGVVAVALLAGSSVETGFAALAHGIALAAAFAVGQVFTLQLPLLVDHGRSITEAERDNRRLAGAAIAAVTPLAIVAVALCEPAVTLLLGDRYAGAAPAIALALTVLPLAPALAGAGQASALRLRAGAGAWAQGVGACAFVVTAVLAVPPWQAIGGSAALLAGAIATLVCSAVVLRDAMTLTLLTASLGGSGIVGLVALTVMA